MNSIYDQPPSYQPPKKEIVDDNPKIIDDKRDGKQTLHSHSPMGDEDVVGTQQETPISKEQEKHLKKHSNQRKAFRVGTTSGAVLLSPLVLLGGGVIATSKFLSPDNNLWDKGMQLAILPASFRKTFRDKPDVSDTCKHFKVDSTPNKYGDARIDGMVMLAKGVPPEVAAKLPCVVIFCQNLASMEDLNPQKLAADYQEHGFNVVMSNYRGVAHSGGQVSKAEDLVADGMAVMDQLVKRGINIGTTDAQILLQPKQNQVILHGTSIGGAVALGVGAVYKDSVLVASRTFTTWANAAEGLVRKVSNPLCSMLVEEIMEHSPKAAMDNMEMLKIRLKDTHNITIIQSAGLTGDDVLTERAKLTEDKIRAEMDTKNPNLYGEEFVRKGDVDDKHDLIDHNTHIPLKESPHLYSKIVGPHADRVQTLKEASKLKDDISTKIDHPIKMILQFDRLDKSIPTLCDSVSTLTKKINEDTPYLHEIETVIASIDKSQVNAAISKLEDLQDDDKMLSKRELLKSAVKQLEDLKKNLSILERTIENS